MDTLPPIGNAPSTERRRSNEPSRDGQTPNPRRARTPFAIRVEAAGLCPEALSEVLDQAPLSERRLKSEVRQYLASN